MNNPRTLSRIELINETDAPRQVWLEPWGEELAMPAGAKWLFVYEENALKEFVTVSYHDGGFAIYGIRDSVARIYDGGKLLWECFEPFSPPVS